MSRAFRQAIVPVLSVSMFLTAPAAAQQAGPSPAPQATPAPPAAPPASAVPRPASAAPKAAPPRSAAYPLDAGALSEKLARNPNQPALLNEYGNQLIRSGKLKDAIVQYQKAIDLQRDFAAAWNNLGVAYLGLGKDGNAANAFKRAIDIRPTYALAFYNLGALYEGQGKFKQAVDNYEAAIRLDRKLADIRYNPHVASTRLLPAAIVKDYIDRGSTYLPAVDSSYPALIKKSTP